MTDEKKPLEMPKQNIQDVDKCEKCGNHSFHLKKSAEEIYTVLKNWYRIICNKCHTTHTELKEEDIKK